MFKYYDYNKAIKYISDRQESVETASLGMHEDWFWTAQDIFQDNQFTKELFTGDILIEAEKYNKERRKGLSIFSDKYDYMKIAGICGSPWATPTLQVIYKDGNEEMVPCYILEGEELPFEEQVAVTAEKQALLLGCLSAPLQDNLTPLNKS